MSFVKCPDFAVYDAEGLNSLRCKVCGVPIAGMSERTKDVRLGLSGNRIETHVIRFTRFHNYVELKMACGQMQFHVTHGCDKCLVAGLSSAELNELMEADLNEQAAKSPDREYYIEMKTRVPTGVVAIKVGGGIL